MGSCIQGFILILAIALVAPAFAQETVPQPAEAAREQSAQQAQPESKPLARSWEALPEYSATVRGERVPKEEELIGEYKQPRWTVPRRFPTTRLYVVPRGTVQFEYWLERKAALEDLKDARYRSQYEFEFGLGHRLQLDLYLATEQSGPKDDFTLYQEKVELRYALAGWGVIPGNPTLYLELVREHGGPPKAEGKLLFGGELASRWHWGLNAVLERQLGGRDISNEYALTGAVAYTALDQILSAGLEIKTEFVDIMGSRFQFESYEILAGPSIQWRPVPAMHVDLVVLLGSEWEKNAAGMLEPTALSEPLLVVGWEF